MKNKKQILLMALIVIIVTIISIATKEGWFLLLYSTILAFYVNEIKDFIEKMGNVKQIRISYSYLFRIESNGYYLLVKDEQGRNNYHPVGGVYKYNPEEIDMSDRYSCEYDNLFDATTDTQDDLRLIMKKNKYKGFKAWFSTTQNRENISDLSREFCEELIDRSILPEDIFRNIRYKYVGSYTEKTFNNQLKIQQIRHFDIVSLKLTNAQRTCLNNLKRIQSEQYVFATKDHILAKHMSFGGRNYEISESSSLILNCNNSKLVKEINVDNEFTVSLKTKKITP